MFNTELLKKDHMIFFDRALEAQRSQLLSTMADAVSECRTADDQAAALSEEGQIGLLRLVEILCALRTQDGQGGMVLEGTETALLSTVLAQIYAYLSQHPLRDPVGMALYVELYQMMAELMLGEWFD